VFNALLTLIRDTAELRDYLAVAIAIVQVRQGGGGGREASCIHDDGGLDMQPAALHVGMHMHVCMHICYLWWQHPMQYC
jgi:hypothetical protein